MKVGGSPSSRGGRRGRRRSGRSAETAGVLSLGSALASQRALSGHQRTAGRRDEVDPQEGGEHGLGSISRQGGCLLQ